MLYAKSNILGVGGTDHIEVFSDDRKENKLYDIKGEYVYTSNEPISHHFTDAQGNFLGRTEREEIYRQLLSASFLGFGFRKWGCGIHKDQAFSLAFKVHQGSYLLGTLDDLFKGSPVSGFISGMARGKHVISDTDEKEVMLMQQQRTLLQRKFTVNALVELEESQQIQILLTLITMILAKDVGNPEDNTKSEENNS